MFEVLSTPEPNDTAKAIVSKIRAHCTPSSEAYEKGGDHLILAVADWIENPPEWVHAPWVVAATPEPDEWCMDEKCDHRHWRSGSMPTHKRGAQCPLITTPEPEPSDEPPTREARMNEIVMILTGHSAEQLARFEMEGWNYSWQYAMADKILHSQAVAPAEVTREEIWNVLGPFIGSARIESAIDALESEFRISHRNEAVK
jgi:hypothetical protein